MQSFLGWSFCRGYMSVVQLWRCSRGPVWQMWQAYQCSRVKGKEKLLFYFVLFYLSDISHSLKVPDLYDTLLKYYYWRMLVPRVWEAGVVEGIKKGLKALCFRFSQIGKQVVPVVKFIMRTTFNQKWPSLKKKWPLNIFMWSRIIELLCCTSEFCIHLWILCA